MTDFRSTAPRGSVLAVLFVGVLIGALDISIVGPALPAIGGSFDVDGRALAWVFNSYVLFYLIGAPLMGKLSDRHGRRRVYAGSLALFAAGSLLVASAPAFEALLAGRVVQAVGAGGMFPIASAVIGDTFPPERRGRALGMIGAVFGVAFLLGPLLGGVLLRWSWQWLFLVNLPIVAVLIGLSWRVLPDGPRRRPAAFDWPGAVGLCVMLGSLAVGVGRLDASALPAAVLSPQVLPFIVAAIVAAPLFWLAERRAADPVLPPALLRAPQLRLIGLLAAATGLVEAGMVFLPAIAVAGLGVGAATASLMMLPLVLTLIAGAPAAGHLVDRAGARLVIQGGLALTGAGLLVMALAPFTTAAFYGAGACIGLGLAGLLGAPLRAAMLREAGEVHRGAGQGLLTIWLSLGRLIGAALIGAMAASASDELGGYRAALLTLAIVIVAALLLSGRLRADSTARGALGVHR